MSDYPERINISPVHRQKREDDFYLVDRAAFPGKGTEYIRATHAQAEKEAAVAAEREAVAAYIDTFLMTKTDVDVEKVVSCVENIRARGNTDALAARDARVKAEALREAANKPEIMELCEGWCASGGLGCFSDCLACLINSAILDQNKESAND